MSVSFLTSVHGTIFVRLFTASSGLHVIVRMQLLDINAVFQYFIEGLRRSLCLLLFVACLQPLHVQWKSTFCPSLATMCHLLGSELQIQPCVRDMIKAAHIDAKTSSTVAEVTVLPQHISLIGQLVSA